MTEWGVLALACVAFTCVVCASMAA
jgi:hypothetical protein